MSVTNFMSLQWWVTVGVATLLFSLFQDAFRRSVYAALGKLSVKWRERNVASRAKFKAAVEAHLDSPSRYASAERHIHSHKLNAIFGAIIASAMSVAAGFLSLGMGDSRISAEMDWPFPHLQIAHATFWTSVFAGVVLLFAQFEFSRSRRLESILNAVDKRRNLPEEPDNAPLPVDIGQKEI